MAPVSAVTGTAISADARSVAFPLELPEATAQLDGFLRVQVLLLDEPAAGGVAVADRAVGGVPLPPSTLGKFMPGSPGKEGMTGIEGIPGIDGIVGNEGRAGAAAIYPAIPRVYVFHLLLLVAGSDAGTLLRTAADPGKSNVLAVDVSECTNSTPGLAVRDSCAR